MAMFAISLQGLSSISFKKFKVKLNRRANNQLNQLDFESIDNDVPYTAESVARGSLELLDDDSPPQVSAMIEVKVSPEVNYNIAMQRETQTIQDERNPKVNQNLMGKVDAPMTTRNSQSNANLSLIKQNALV